MKVRGAIFVSALAMAGGCAGSGPAGLVKESLNGVRSGSADQQRGENEYGKVDATQVGSSPTVAVKDRQFSPKVDEVSMGTEITWTSAEPVAHTVTSGKRDAPDGRFDQPLDGLGSSFSFVFAEAGSYDYHCKVHTTMDGQILVK